MLISIDIMVAEIILLKQNISGIFCSLHNNRGGRIILPNLIISANIRYSCLASCSYLLAVNLRWKLILIISGKANTFCLPIFGVAYTWMGWPGGEAGVRMANQMSTPPNINLSVILSIDNH